MSLVLTISFVIGLFALVGLIAGAAVMHGLTTPRGAVSRPTALDASFDESREPVSV